MSLRVIAGELRGRPLAAPPGLATRPSAARLRETLFNLLGPLDGLSFLDGYAGSGAIGIEAYSRGARPVAFIRKGIRGSTPHLPAMSRRTLVRALLNIIVSGSCYPEF